MDICFKAFQRPTAGRMLEDATTTATARNEFARPSSAVVRAVLTGDLCGMGWQLVALAVNHDGARWSSKLDAAV